MKRRFNDLQSIGYGRGSLTVEFTHDSRTGGSTTTQNDHTLHLVGWPQPYTPISPVPLGLLRLSSAIDRNGFYIWTVRTAGLG